MQYSDAEWQETQASQPVVQDDEQKWWRDPVNSALSYPNQVRRASISVICHFTMTCNLTRKFHTVLHFSTFKRPWNSLAFGGFLVTGVFYRAEMNASLMSLCVHCITHAFHSHSEFSDVWHTENTLLKWLNKIGY